MTSVHSGSAVIDGVRWHFHIAGAGPAVVFLHGLGAAASTWDLLEPTIGREFTCLAIDLPGYSVEHFVQLPLTFAELSAGVSELIEHLGLGSVAIVGHSLGGTVALLVAETGCVDIRELVLIAPAGFGDEIGRAVPFAASSLGAAAIRIAHSRVVFKSLTAYVSVRSRMNVDFRSTAVAQAYDGLSRLRSREARRQLSLSARAALHARSTLEMPDTFGEPTRRLPVFIIWGRIDTIFPSIHSSVAASRFLGARVAIIDRAGHAPHRTHPEEVSRSLLTFLREHVTG